MLYVNIRPIQYLQRQSFKQAIPSVQRSQTSSTILAVRMFPSVFQSTSPFSSVEKSSRDVREQRGACRLAYWWASSATLALPPPPPPVCGKQILARWSSCVCPYLKIQPSCFHDLRYSGAQVDETQTWVAGWRLEVSPALSARS